MRVLFGLFSLENAEAVAAELGAEAVNLIAADNLRERLHSSRAEAAPGTGGAAPAHAPALLGLLARKRPVFLGEAGSVYAANELAADIIQMAQSSAPTKRAGSLRVALEEFGVATYYAEAYARGVQQGYVLVFCAVDDDQVLELGNRLEGLGGREVFGFQRLD
jgi:hypothetical protein